MASVNAAEATLAVHANKVIKDLVEKAFFSVLLSPLNHLINKISTSQVFLNCDAPTLYIPTLVIFFHAIYNIVMPFITVKVILIMDLKC